MQFQPVQKLSYRHDAIMDMMLANPGMKIWEIAQRLGISRRYAYILTASDMFKARLAERREAMRLRAEDSWIEQCQQAVSLGLKRVNQELEEAECDAGFALSASEKALKMYRQMTGAGEEKPAASNVVNIQQNNYHAAPDAIEEARQLLAEVHGAKALPSE